VPAPRPLSLKRPTQRCFPFTAIVGQEEMKLACCFNVIDPRIGGVMIPCDRGNGQIDHESGPWLTLLPGESTSGAGDPYNRLKPTEPRSPERRSAGPRAESGETLPTASPAR